MGDGELECMRGDSGKTCDGQKYSQELAHDLKKAYIELGKHGAYINRWGLGMEDEIEKIEKEIGYKLWFDGYFLLHRNDSPIEETKEFWKAIRNDERFKIFVCPQYLSSVKGDFKFNEVFWVSGVNAYSDIEETVKKILEIIPNDGILVASCGPAAKILISKIVAQKPNITAIDSGSSFDSLYGRVSRTNQIYKPFLKIYGT